MTGKEVIRCILNGETPPRLPWAPCIDPYTRSGLAPELQSLDVFALQRHFGSDMYRGGWASGERLEAPVRHTRTNLPDGGFMDVYETPRGSLRQVHTFTPASPYIPFPTEHLIKNFEDLDTYLYILDHTEIVPDYQRLQETIDAYPEAMITAAVNDTPLPVLMTKLIGTEDFVYMHAEEPERMEAAMARMQAKHIERIKVAAQGPAEVYICYENTNTKSFGLRWIEQFEIPHLNDYADVMHAAGKKLLVHMCGHINLVVDRLAQARFDGIIDVATPPTGDLDLARAVDVMGRAGKAIGGGIDCTTFILPDPDEFERRVSSMLGSLTSTCGYLFGSGDAVPQGATEANLLRAGALARSTFTRA
jgi:hypothetical protein